MTRLHGYCGEFKCDGLEHSTREKLRGEKEKCGVVTRREVHLIERQSHMTSRQEAEAE